jgi:Ca-activated chloride channel family protein
MRTFALARRLSLAAVVMGAALLAAPAAFANGILVVDPGTVPMPPDRARPMPPRPPENLVRLKAHRVSAVVVDQTAEFTVEQTFHSDAAVQLEGTYLFPLPEGASVGKFAMTMGGKMVEGSVLEANEARRIYQGIVSRRRDPGLLEYMGRGLFQARVFPILPHSDLTIRLVFQTVLRDDTGTLELRYPLASERLNGQPVDEVVMDVKVESSVDLKTVWSPSHEVAIVREGERKARVSFERSGRRQDKDFLLYLGRSPDAVGFSLVSARQAGEDGTFMAVFAPRQTATGGEVAPKDVVYVVDVSGSMAGEKMTQAQKTLKLGVSMLRPGDRFNVIAFSTGVTPFRDGLVEATAEVKAAATSWIDALQAVGGTNIEGALEAALKAQSAGRLPLVVFITDGRPTVGERGTEELLKKAQAANLAKARVFTFGVGHDLDVALLDRLAEGTNGVRDYVTPGEDLEVVTGRFFTKVDRPVMTDVTVELGSGVYDVYPQRIPDLFAGSQVVIFGRYKESGERTLLLRGKLAGKAGVQEVVLEHRGSYVATGGPGWLPRLWAHRKVAFLLDEIRLRGETKETVDEVVRLATRYAIVTPYTAGLVVEDGELEAQDGRRPGMTSASPLGTLGGARDRLRLPADAGAPQQDPGMGGLAPRAGSGGGAMPPPTTPPPSTREPAPAPAAPVVSEELKRLKEKAAEESRDDDKDLPGRARERVQAVGTKSFVKKADGRWVDTAYDGKAETKKIEAYSDAWTALLATSDELARILALGERVVFLHQGTVYEVVPAAK